MDASVGPGNLQLHACPFQNCKTAEVNLAQHLVSALLWVVCPTTSEGMLARGVGEIVESQDKRQVCPDPTEPPEM